MKRTFLAIALALAISTSTQAKTPKEVLEPYKAYRAALKEGNSEIALKQAKAAWEAAELHLGDNKTTGDLAQNFADIKSSDGYSKAQIKALERAIELSSFYGEDANSMYLQRGVRLLESHFVNGDMGKIRKSSKALINYAKENDLERSVFYAEILTLQSGSLVRFRDGQKMIDITENALDIFAKPAESAQTVYPIFAHLYNGFGHEYEENVLEAALSYQKVMEYVGELDYETHPIVGRALGRWIHMRGRLQDAGEFEAAKKKGLCDCWPYNIERNESVKPLKRFPPKFPSQALSGVSGYTIVQFDLDDDGNTINHKKIVSWPGDIYEKPAMRSLEKWEYSPRVEGETDADRSNLISTIRFNIEDRYGNPVY